EPAPTPPPTVLDGIVRRSGGKSTIWLNQVPQAGPDNKLQHGTTLALPLSSGRIVILKPGQSFNPADGSVSEDHGR
ncbi:hypothetical protein, partial [Janthinobacterium sp.]|uniref:hypothetical protein n=1 Tax=Janthinobacterium sp. TaxID=1871054 RepID=UPI00293D8724